MEKYFTQSAVAQQYDLSMFKTMPGYTELLEYISNYVFNATTKKNEIDLLDIGCGTGNVAKAILKKKRCDQLSLLDHSRFMLSIAEKKLQKDQAYHSLLHFNNDFYSGLCEVIQAGFYYDVITSGFCLDHIECDIEYIRVLNKIHDSLKDDGFYFHIEKSADKKNIASSSWLMYEKLVLLRKNKMIDLGIKSEKEANEFEHHVLNDDFLRSKKDQILLIKKSNLKIHDIFGLEVGYENELNDNYFNGHFQVRKMNLEDTDNDSKAFIPLVIVCKK